MALYFGANTPGAYYVGTNTVSTIYKGSTQVWPVTAPPVGGGITYVGAGTVFDTAATSGTVPAPAGFAAGDLLLMQFGCNVTGTVTTPAGWTSINLYAGTDYHSYLWYRIADGTETSGVTLSNGVAFTAVMWAYRGVNTTTPFDVAMATTATTTGVTTIVAPSLTPVTTGDIFVYAGSGANGTRTFTASGTSRAQGGVNGKALFVFEEGPLGTTAATGSRTVTINSANRTNITSILLRAA